MPDERQIRFLAIFNVVEAHVEKRYGIPVTITDVPHPFTGDLDGAEIQIDYENNPEEAAFCLVHLFGHTVQWNVSPEARDLGIKQLTQPDPSLIGELRRYELEACGYSLQLFHDAGVDDVDQWLSDFAAADLAYLEHFYVTGEKKAFRSFWKQGTELIEPVPIPDFHPTKWRGRWEGVVI